jgi:predicted trehalose synthase
MLRSYDYAAYAALGARHERGLIGAGDEGMARARARRWRDDASTTFLRGYTQTSGIDEVLPTDGAGRDALLSAFIIEKALYELRYELDNRPDWVRLPLGALAELVER